MDMLWAPWFACLVALSWSAVRDSTLSKSKLFSAQRRSRDHEHANAQQKREAFSHSLETLKRQVVGAALNLDTIINRHPCLTSVGTNAESMTENPQYASAIGEEDGTKIPWVLPPTHSNTLTIYHKQAVDSGDMLFVYKGENIQNRKKYIQYVETKCFRIRSSTESTRRQPDKLRARSNCENYNS